MASDEGPTSYIHYHLQDSPNEHSIRLFDLLPGSGKNVECHIITTTIDHPPSYEAISYTSQNHKPKRRITCEGLRLDISEDLYECLKALRQKRGRRTLWADSICINQTDAEEKAKQVKIMGGIFKNATAVLAWFGRKTPFTEDAFELVGSLLKDAIEMVGGCQWTALRQLLKARWLKRMWVIQEIGLAKRGLVICGDLELPWADMKTAAMALHWACKQLVRSNGLDIRELVKMSRINFQGNDQTLFDLLKTARNFQISDERDKAFALLGHGAFEKAKKDFPVFYKGSYTYRKVYIKTAQLLLNQKHGLRGLSLVGHTLGTMEDATIPSWVPQWNIGNHCPVLVGRKEMRFKAAGCTISRESCEDDDKTLVVQGFRLDSVKWRSEVFQWTGIWDRSSEIAGRASDLSATVWRYIVQGLPSKQANQKELLVKFCLTLNAGGCIREDLDDNDRIADSFFL